MSKLGKKFGVTAKIKGGGRQSRTVRGDDRFKIGNIQVIFGKPGGYSRKAIGEIVFLAGDTGDHATKT